MEHESNSETEKSVSRKAASLMEMKAKSGMWA